MAVEDAMLHGDFSKEKNWRKNLLQFLFVLFVFFKIENSIRCLSHLWGLDTITERPNRFRLQFHFVQKIDEKINSRFTV